MAAALQRAERILRQESAARHFHAGFNLGRAAGAGVDGHLHAHVVPRGTAWEAAGEGRDPLGPGLSVSETFTRLRPAFAGD
jgi:ATP adenylyltransferase